MSTIGTIHDHLRPDPSRRISAGRLARLVGMVAEWLETATEKRRGRRALRQLTDEQLADIGISRAEALREADRPFWDWSSSRHY